MTLEKEEKFINILLLFYVLSSLNFIFYKYSVVINIFFIFIEICFVIKAIREKIIIPKKTMILFYFFCIHIVIAWAMSNYRAESMFSSIQFIILNIFTVFILVHTKKDYSDKILCFFVGYALVLVIYSLVMKTLFPQLVATKWGIKGNVCKILGVEIIQLVYGMPGEYGYASITNNPNSFGFICSVALSVYNSKFYKMNLKSHRKSIMKKIIVNCLLCLGVILSHSRGAFIIVFIMFYFQFIVSKIFKKRKDNLEFIIINLVFICCILLLILLKSNIINNFLMSISDLNGRAEIWTALKETASSEKILIGEGYGTISKIITTNILGNMNSFASYSAFNVYISVFVELGVIGLGFLVIWIVYTINLCINNIKLLMLNDKKLLEREITILSFIIAIYIISIVENKIMSSTYFNLIWITLTIGIIKRNLVYSKINWNRG